MRSTSSETSCSRTVYAAPMGNELSATALKGARARFDIQSDKHDELIAFMQLSLAVSTHDSLMYEAQ